MANEQLAETSNLLFNVAFVGYLIAALGYFFRLAFTRVTVEGTSASTSTGRRIGLAATATAIGFAGVHLASVVTRGMAAGRVPWANMYEYSSLMALTAVVAGLVFVQQRFGYGHLMGFVLAGAVLMMTTALMLFTEAGPVVPALNSYWIKIHTSAAMAASAVFIVGFVASALYLVKDSAERRVAAESGASFSGSTVGAAYAPSPDATDQRPEGYAPDEERHDIYPRGAGLDVEVASPTAQRDVMSPVWFTLVPFGVVTPFSLLVQHPAQGAVIAGVVAALLGAATWFAIPHLPPAANLDSLAYRVIAFGFPIWTFAVIAGAIWAEEAWGRYWGWDPKETGSFFTWTLYAAYLHARATRGWRGRNAAWIAVVAFGALMVTYYAVNLWVVGLHSYAGVN